MSDTSGPNGSSKLDEESSATVFDEEIGDDWGEAFEAEEFMETPDLGDAAEFFLEDSESIPTDIEADVSDEPASSEAKASAPSFLTTLLNPRSILQKAGALFFTWPLIFRILLPASLVLFGVGLWFVVGALSPQDGLSPQTAIKKGAVSEDNSSLEIKEAGGMPEAMPVGETGAEMPSVSVPEPVRENWRLPPFLVSAQGSSAGDDIFFVEADITLVLVQTDDSKPVTDADVILVRDIIYQFFVNKPIYELRRYSLARGEMNRKLRGWLEKQWSKREIAVIVFNRYQIL